MFRVKPSMPLTLVQFRMNNQGVNGDTPLTRVGIALAEPVRQGILLSLLDGPARPGELLGRLGVSKTNLSNHLACLRGCGLIVGDQRGRTIVYRLVSAEFEHALRDLLRLESGLCDSMESADRKSPNPFIAGSVSGLSRRIPRIG